MTFAQARRFVGSTTILVTSQRCHCGCSKILAIHTSGDRRVDCPSCVAKTLATPKTHIRRVSYGVNPELAHAA